MIKHFQKGSQRVQFSNEVAVSSSCVCISLSLSRLKWLMCSWLRPKVLMVITLLSLTLIISCLRGAITEASTSNSAELKKRKKEKKEDGGKTLEALQIILNVKRGKK